MALRGTASATSASAATSLAITVSGIGGTGPQNGDIVVLSGTWGGGAALTVSCSGFSAVPGISNVGLATSNNTFFALYKVAGGSEPSSYTVSKGAGADFGSIQCNVFSGRNTSSPFTAATSVAATLHATPISIAVPTLTAATGDDILFLCGEGNNITSGGGVTFTLTVPSGYANKTDTNSAVANVPATSSCSNQNVAAGATGTVTGSVAWTGSAGSDDGAGYLISIAAAPVGTIGTWIQTARNSTNTAYVNITPATGNALIINSATSSGGGTPTVTLIEAYNAVNGTGILLTNTFVIPLATTQVVAGTWETGAYLLNLPAGVKSVLLHFNGGAPGSLNIQAVEVSGLTAFLTSARQYQAAPGTTANVITSTTSSVSSIPAYILGVTNNGGHTTTAAGTSFTQRGTVDINWFVEDRRETGATGSYAATATDATNGGTDAYTTSMMAFSDTVFVVQSVNTQSIVTNALTVTINGVTNGNTLAAIGSFWSQSSVTHNMIPPVTDTTFALSFQSLQTQNGTGTLPNNYGCGIWFLAGGLISAGSHTVKLDFAPFGISLTQGSLTIVEISGVAAASPADPTQPSSLNGTTANTITVSSGQNLAAVPAISLAAVITGTSTGVANAAFSCAGFTDLTGSPDNNTTNGIGSEHVYKIYSVIGTTSAAFSWTDASTGRIQSVIGVLSSQSGIVTLPLLGMILM